MKKFMTTVGAAALLATVMAASAANATLTTFATISATTGPNFEFKNANSKGKSASGELFTIAPSSGTPGTTVVTFSLINLGATLDNAFKNIVADFTFDAFVTATPAVLGAGNQIVQPGITGSFSLISTTAVTYGSHTLAAGSNLLSATFTNAVLAGTNKSTGGGVNGNNQVAGQTLVYTSDFLNFAAFSGEDASLSLSAALPKLTSVLLGTYALSTFKGTTGGSFSSSPPPTVGVPEPASWALMLVGVGAVGGMMRRRKTVVAA